MRVYLCPTCQHGTVHPDSVGSLQGVEPSTKLKDKKPACERVNTGAHAKAAAEAVDSAVDGGDLKSLGGGRYELPNGETVKGKKAAAEALAALKVDEAATGGAAPATG